MKSKVKSYLFYAITCISSLSAFNYLNCMKLLQAKKDAQQPATSQTTMPLYFDRLPNDDIDITAHYVLGSGIMHTDTIFDAIPRIDSFLCLYPHYKITAKSLFERKYGKGCLDKTLATMLDVIQLNQVEYRAQGINVEKRRNVLAQSLFAVGADAQGTFNCIVNACERCIIPAPAPPSLPSNFTVEILRLLKENGCVLSEKNSFGRTALYYAALFGLDDIVVYLIENGLDVNESTGLSAIPTIATSAQAAAVDAATVVAIPTIAASAQAAAVADATVAIARESNGLAAVTDTLVDTLSTLPQISIDPTVIKLGGATPLCVAARKAHLSIMKLLLAAGADKNGIKNSPPLCAAAASGSAEAVQLLLEAGAEVNCMDALDKTPLYYAIKGGYATIFDLLIAAGASTTYKCMLHKEDMLDIIQYASQKNEQNAVALQVLEGIKQTVYNSKRKCSLLTCAVLYDRAVQVKMLLENGCSLDESVPNALTDLIWAIVGGYNSVVEVLLAAHPSKAYIDSCDSRMGLSALSLAMLIGRDAIVELLQSAHAELSDDMAIMVLLQAISEGNINKVERLLKAGVKLKNIALSSEEKRVAMTAAAALGDEQATHALQHGIQAISNINPLSVALCLGTVDMVRLLRQHGADIFASFEQGCTALSLAAGNNTSDMLQYLLDEGLDINAVSSTGRAALFDAVCSKKKANVDFLCQAGATVNCQLTNGATALIGAVEINDEEIIRILLRYQANVNLANQFGMTPLSFACRTKNSAIMRLLIAAGAQINFQETIGAGCTPLILAVQSRSFDMITLLVDAGAFIDMPDRQGSTPLLHATEIGDEAAVKYLLLKHAAVNICTDNKLSPLMNAVCFGKIEIVRLLIEAGADVNYVGLNGFTPLMCAVNIKNCEIARLLLAHDADIWKRNKDNKTAMQLARDSENNEMIDLFDSAMHKTASKAAK